MRPRLALATTIALFGLVLGAASASAALKAFQSPSGNIGCVMTSGGDGVRVRCDIARHSWRAPPKPKSCPLDWGNGVEVAARGRAHYVCAGDTALHIGGHLAYGHSIRLGKLRCTSLQSGMRCTSRASGHGFTLSLATVRLH